MEKDITYNKNVLIVPLLALLSIWLIYYIEIRFGMNFNKYGIFPQEVVGLRGILFSPFIHSNDNHLLNNSVPLAVMLWALFYFYDSIAFNQENTGRQIARNQFTISQDWQKDDTISIPLYISESNYQQLWQDTLHTNVRWVDFQEPVNTLVKHSIPTDSVFKRLLQVSDNFLAEQLILLCSWKLFGQLNSDSTIALLTDSLLSDLPQAPIWVDGSGLSRYNLFTPMSLVTLLHKIYQEVDEKRLFELLPAGGKSGTIKEYYQADPPYIFAKTGTLRNNHALSGYLITKRGKRLIFSFMHNHYPGSSIPVKREMERILWQIHSKY